MKDVDVSKALYELLKKYYDTISTTGYLPNTSVKKLLILLFFEELVKEPDYVFTMDCINDCELNKIYECLIDNNCLYV